MTLIVLGVGGLINLSVLLSGLQVPFMTPVVRVDGTAAIQF